jgi:hypothetical protein
VKHVLEYVNGHADRVMADIMVETYVSLASQQVRYGRAVITVKMYVEIFKSDVIVFIGNFICLMSH